MVTELAEPGLVPFVSEVASSNQQEFQNLRREWKDEKQIFG